MATATLLAAPRAARAQTATLPSGWVVVRTNSPRAFENGGAVPAPGHDTGGQPAQIGLRDCTCGENWHIVGTLLDPAPPGTTAAQFFVSTAADSCATAVDRTTNPSVATTQTCLPIGYSPLHGGVAVGSLGFDIDVPAGFLVNPTTGRCDTTSSVTQSSAIGSLYFNVVYLPSGDPATVVNFAYDYDYEPPPAPVSVAAVPQPGGAAVSWSTGTDATTPDLAGYYIVQWPPPDAPPATFAAADVASCGDASGDAVDPAATCSTPPPSFDVDDDAVLRRFVATDLLALGSETTTVIRGLAVGSAHRFAVIAQDRAGNRSLSSWSDCATTTTAAPPGDGGVAPVASAGCACTVAPGRGIGLHGVAAFAVGLGAVLARRARRRPRRPLRRA